MIFQQETEILPEKPGNSTMDTATTAAPMEEESEVDQSKAEAQEEKEQGNAAYKARKFEQAIKHYDAAINLDDSDISFLTNRFATLSEILAESAIIPVQHASSANRSSLQRLFY